jgi:hypothetical protein
VQRLLPADPRRQVPALLHAQLEAAREVRLGLRDLLIGHDLVPEQRELAQDRVDRPSNTPRVDAGGDLQGARVRVLDHA